MHTSIPNAPRHTVEDDDKKHAHLNLIAHLLSLVRYEDIPHQPITLSERMFDPHYERHALPQELYVPSKY